MYWRVETKETTFFGINEGERDNFLAFKRYFSLYSGFVAGWNRSRRSSVAQKG
jgi:hypothetical protein